MQSETEKHDILTASRTRTISARFMAIMFFVLAASVAGCEYSNMTVPGMVAPKPSVNRSAELAGTNLPALNAPAQPMDTYKGRGGLLVAFLDTKCPYSAITVRGIDAVSQILAPYGVPVVVVNLDDPKESVQKYYQAHAVRAPVLYDTTTTTKKSWQITRVPTLVLLDAAGREAYVGRTLWPNVANAAETMLKLPPDTLYFPAESTPFS